MFDSIVANKMSLEQRFVTASLPFIAEFKKQVEEALKNTVQPTETSVRASMKNVLNGSLVCQVKGYMEHRPVVFELSAAIEGGKIKPIAVETMLEGAKTALEASKKVVKPSVEAKKFSVDLKAFKATRTGDMVVFQHSGLPEWGLRVNAADFKAENGSKAVANRVRASVQGWCVSQIGRDADFGSEEFRLPVVAAIVVKKAEPSKPADWLASEILGQAQVERMIQSQHQELQASAKPVFSAESSLKSEERRRLEMVARMETETLAREYMVNVIKGGNPVVKTVDISGLSEDERGRRHGSIVYAFSFYGNRSMEEANIEVPYGEDGHPVKANISRSKADLLLAEKRKKELEVLSQEERKGQLEKFKANNEKMDKLFKDAGLQFDAISYGYGSTFQKRLPADMIPIRKTMLPEEFSVEGKLIFVDGFVYKIEATEAGSTSVEKNANWMLRLQSDKERKDVDYHLHYASAADILASIGGR